MRWLERRRWHRAAKAYARKLGRELAAGYGTGGSYTVGQVDTAIVKARLDPEYRALGYAAFLDPEEFSRLQASLPKRIAREIALILLKRYAPWSEATSAEFQDASGLSGVDHPYRGVI